MPVALIRADMSQTYVDETIVIQWRKKYKSRKWNWQKYEWRIQRNEDK